MSQDFWLGVLAIPVATAAGVALFYAIIGARVLAGKAFGAMLRVFPAIREGEDIGAAFPMRTRSDFGHRSAFAAIALTARKMIMFEPFHGLGIFIMLGKPDSNTKQARRAKHAIEDAYEARLEEDQTRETKPQAEEEPTHE